jgi:DNA-binding CsgD family transcriptional regulator/GAF domain-containing protein
MGSYAKERAVERIARAAGQGLDLVGFWEEARDAIARAIPHHLAPCWYTLDPASLLVTSHYDHGVIPELPPEWLAHEYREDDCHKLTELARSSQPTSTLHEVTGGDPSSSPRFKRYIEPYGGEQELLLPLRARTGEAWGVLALYRTRGQTQFSSEERELLGMLAPHLAEGARRGLLVGEATEPEQPGAPGLVVLTDGFETESLTPGVELWLKRLPGGEQAPDRLPQAVLSVAGQALRTADAEVPGEVAFARVLASDGRWIVLHGAVLQTEARQRVAVIVEPAHPARISPLLMAAYGLSDREQEIARQVLAGAATAEIADTLHISPHTVQQHLKRIFEKSGVRSRRELVAKVFFTHYEPRLRDNELRALDGRALRGGPAVAAPDQPAEQQRCL